MIEISCKGKVKCWNEEKGFGFVESPLGLIYAHASCVDSGEMKAEKKAEFMIGRSDKGMVARHIKVVD